MYTSLTVLSISLMDQGSLLFNQISSKVEASDGTEAFNLLVAAVNSADERVRISLNPQKDTFFDFFL